MPRREPRKSGKTTTTRKLAEYLEKQGLGLVELNVDHYFFDLEAHPKDEFGDYDFETPQALDLPLINTHIKQLLNGEHIRIPRYDFKEGKQYPNQIPMHLKKNEIILIDSLHGLYGDMLDGIVLHPPIARFLSRWQPGDPAVYLGALWAR